MLLTVSATDLRPGLEAANTITVGVGDASPGKSDVHVIVTATNDVSIHGYSIAFTYPTPEQRNGMVSALFEKKVLALPCGSCSVRFRLPLILNEAEAGDLLTRFAQCSEVGATAP